MSIERIDQPLQGERVVALSPEDASRAATDWRRRPNLFAGRALTDATLQGRQAWQAGLTLRDMTFPDLAISRELGYTLGFFMFWLATAASSLFTWILLRPASRFNRALPPE